MNTADAYDIFDAQSVMPFDGAGGGERFVTGIREAHDIRINPVLVRRDVAEC